MSEVEKILEVNNVRQFISENQIAMAKMDQVEVPIVNYFSKDVYAREMTVKKGTLLIGKIHKFQNLNILSQGEVSVLSIDGCLRIKAPYTFVASPGSQRIFYAHEDSVWTTVHGTPEVDVEKIENEFIAKSYDELPGGNLWLG